MRPQGWLDVTGDMLRDAASVAQEIDPHDEYSLRLEVLSDGTLTIRRLGGGKLRIVREGEDA